MKPSEIFEGENSGLRKAFDEAVGRGQILIDQRRAAIEENLKSMNNCRVFEPHTMTYTKLKIDNSPRGSLISLLGAMNCDTAKPWVDEIIHQALAEERERVVELIKSRKPNEYAVRQYKTMEARTWDEKNLVIEALDDLLASLDKPLTDK